MSTVTIIGRMLLALVVVLGIMWVLARWARKPLTGKADRVMAVLARQQLNRSSSVTVLRVMDRALVLGITEQGIQLLAETDLAAVEEALVVEPTTGRKIPGLLRARPNPLALEPADAKPVFMESAPLAVTSYDGSAAVTGFPTPPPTSAALPAGTEPARRSSLDGSVLSPNTWKQLVGAARELTVRR